MSRDTPSSGQNSSNSTNRLYPVSSETLQTVFYVLLFGWTVWLLVQASEWEWDDRIFPYLIGLPLCLLVGAKILKLRTEISMPLQPSDDETESIIETATDESARPVGVKQRYELTMLAWVVAFPVASYYFGFLLVVPVYLCSFLWYFQRDLKLAIAVSVVGSVGLYLLFVVLLDVSVWEGTIDVFSAVGT